MTRAFTALAAIAAAAGGLVALALPGGPALGHGDLFSAGEPGDPKRPSRTIVVVMNEVDAKMVYIPNRIEVRRGEQIKFILRNIGEGDHEFLLATTAENLKHGEEMKKNPDMEHDEPNGKRIASKKTAELIWKFSKAGEFEYGCLIPGHREAGMVGRIIVK